MESPQERRGRGKTRDEGLKEAILKSAAELLLEKGFKGFTMEGVAAKSGASKVTLYKWWSTKGTLALDAYVDIVTDAISFPHTDDPRRDLEQQLAAVIGRFTQTAAGTVMMELIGGAQEDPVLKRELAQRYILPRRELAGAAFARLLGWDFAANRDRLGAITDQVYGAIYNRLLFGFGPLDEAFAKELIAFWVPEREPGRPDA